MTDLWNAKLKHPVVPRSGPMNRMTTLIEAARALARELPPDRQSKPHWTRASTLLVKAGESGSTADIQVATDELMRALDREGWSI